MLEHERKNASGLGIGVRIEECFRVMRAGFWCFVEWESCRRRLGAEEWRGGLDKEVAASEPLCVGPCWIRQLS